jgi:hypothetical protein
MYRFWATVSRPTVPFTSKRPEALSGEGELGPLVLSFWEDAWKTDEVQDWGEGIGRAEMIGFGLPARLSRVLHRAKFAPDPEYRQGKRPTLRCYSPTLKPASKLAWRSHRA